MKEITNLQRKMYEAMIHNQNREECAVLASDIALKYLSEFVEFCEEEYALFIPSWVLDGFVNNQPIHNT